MEYMSGSGQIRPIMTTQTGLLVSHPQRQRKLVPFSTTKMENGKMQCVVDSMGIFVSIHQVNSSDTLVNQPNSN